MNLNFDVAFLLSFSIVSGIQLVSQFRILSLTQPHPFLFSVDKMPGIETHVLDVTDWDKARKTIEDLGPIDLLVNNAGTACPEPFLDVKKETLYKYIVLSCQPRETMTSCFVCKVIRDF